MLALMPEEAAQALDLWVYNPPQQRSPLAYLRHTTALRTFSGYLTAALGRYLCTRPRPPVYQSLCYCSHEPTSYYRYHHFTTTMPAKKRCQHEEGCRNAALRLVGQCPHCTSQFCGDHRLPEHHMCTGMSDCKQQAFEKNKARLEQERTVASKMTTA